MKHLLPMLRIICRSIYSPHGLMLIVFVSLLFNAPLAEAQTTPGDKPGSSVQDRKSAWKVHAVRGNRPVYRRGGEILVKYQAGANRGC